MFVKALCICIYALHIYIYGNIYSCAQPEQHIYIYIYTYIYIVQQTLNNHVQATDAAGSSSQHSIMIQQSPPEATKGFYQETSR